MPALTKFHEQTIQKMCKARGIDWQTIDYHALWDNTLTEKESYALIQQELAKYQKNKTTQQEQDMLQKIKKYENQAQDHELEQLEQKRNQAIQEIKNKETPELDKYFKKLYGYIDALIDGDNNNLFIIGDCGTGKSTNIIKRLIKRGTDYRYISGNITPLELYHELHANQNKLIVFDDTIHLITDKQAMAILYSSMWSAEGERIVEWRSTSSKLNAPKRFAFNGKIIFLLNAIPPDNIWIRTLLSRCLAYELKFNYNTMLEIMYEMAKILTKKTTPQENNEVIDWLRENTKPTTKNFNLRTFIKIRDLKQSNPQNWQELARELWEINH